ncbi:helix-turn-helix domain-containing protein [Paenibacillus sp. y28]|uniref:helix-turn-helix domain-containing protein n=1 Tax=Paenibacillus sp. y28 TaxID=3129110 RepID=UPI003019EA8F
MSQELRQEFGRRVKELRARSGMSQELLAHRSGLDRSYIGSVERGERNISLDNIERIAAAFHVPIAYLFAAERFPVTPGYAKKEFEVPFSERFKYHVDAERKLLAFQVNGALSGQDAEKMSAILLNASSAFAHGELNLLIDHREMKASDGQPIVYSPKIADMAISFQQKMFAYSNNIVVLCNSEFMVNQMDVVTRLSGVYDKSAHFFGQDQDILGQAYRLLDIHGHDLVQTNHPKTPASFSIWLSDSSLST